LTIVIDRVSKATAKTPTIKIEIRIIAAITIGSFLKGVEGAGGGTIGGL
jgi:hypothetical protein